MKVIDMLRKAGLITVAGEVQAAPSQPAPEPPPEAPDLPPNEELSIPFSEIYAALKLPAPAHGWSVDKVLAALESPHMKELDPKTQRAALLAMLAANGVPPEEIVEDAARRDQALDKYEAFARRKLDQRQAGLKEEIVAEEGKIRASEQAIAEKRARLDREAGSFTSWLDRKVQEEETLVRVVSLFTPEHGITVGPVEPVKPKRARENG